MRRLWPQTAWGQAELPDVGLTGTPSFFKVFGMPLRLRCSPGGTALWGGGDKTTSPGEPSGDVLPVLCAPPASAPLAPGAGGLAETSQLVLLELSLPAPQELPLLWQDLAGTSVAFHGTLENISVWIWVQALLSKLVTPPVQFPYSISAICIMPCIHYMHNIAFLLQMP